MRLLTRLNGYLELVAEDDREPVRPYAILSHVWLAKEEEVTFEDIEVSNRSHQHDDSMYRKKPGYAKINFCLDQAQRDNLNYVWVDTCCIDKRNNTELSTAINFMYAWYARSQRCYVYLLDIKSKPCCDPGQTSTKICGSSLIESRWFSRGWTLQELLAPNKLDFYSENASWLGSRSQVAQAIHAKTSIPISLLEGTGSLQEFTLRQRYEWAIGRETTVPEDIVYCLFGLLEVYFVPIYGVTKLYVLQELYDKLQIRHNDGNFLLDYHPELRKSIESRMQIKRVAENRTSLEDTLLGDLLKRLEFANQDHRRQTVKEHVTSTCDWILQHEVYDHWISGRDVGRSNGLLWIKGHAGTGKSTMIKFIETQLSFQKTEDDVLVAFYFNARGNRMEKSVVGAYRSLSCQLIEALPLAKRYSTASILSERLRRTPFDINAWSIELHRTLLKILLDSFEHQKIYILIDALDECQVDEAQDMLYFFEELGQTACSNARHLSMCFTSRYYPAVSIDAFEIKLDEQTGHSDDLHKYIQASLRVGRDARATTLRTRLYERANGSFIWAVSAVPILNKEYRNGRTLNMLKKLDSLPGNLKALYWNMIERDKDRMDEFILCIQWVLFATSPLSPEMFYAAMIFGTGLELDAMQDEGDETRAGIERYVSSCSKGFVEVTPGQSSCVQFTHETIREYFLEELDLGRIWHATVSAHCASHNVLKRICIEFLVSHLNRWRIDPQDPYGPIEGLPRSHEFVAYAALSALQHAEEAVPQVDQHDVIKHYSSKHLGDFEDIMGLKNLKFRATSGTLVHLVILHSGPNMLKYCLKNQPGLLEQRSSENGRWTPLHLACWNNADLAVVKCLLDEGANVEAVDDAGNTALLLAIPASSLSSSAAVVELLLKQGADITKSNADGHSALMLAAKKGACDVVVALLDHYQSIGKEDSNVSDALHLTVEVHRADKLQAMLDAGLPIDACDTNGRSLLHNALRVESGPQEPVVSTLLEHDVNQRLLDHNGSTALQAAYECRSIINFEWLLDVLDLNVVNGSGNSILLHAIKEGAKRELIVMLLNHGAKGRVKDHGQRNDVLVHGRLRLTPHFQELLATAIPLTIEAVSSPPSCVVVQGDTVAGAVESIHEND